MSPGLESPYWSKGETGGGRDGSASVRERPVHGPPLSRMDAHDAVVKARNHAADTEFLVRLDHIYNRLI